MGCCHQWPSSHVSTKAINAHPQLLLMLLANPSLKNNAPKCHNIEYKLNTKDLRLCCRLGFRLGLAAQLWLGLHGWLSLSLGHPAQPVSATEVAHSGCLTLI